MPLLPLPLPTWTAPLPAAARAFLRDADARTARLLAAAGPATGRGFVPSDHEQVFRALAALRQLEPDARRFCEWGSGLGVAVGSAALLGFEAAGIEVAPDLVEASRALLEDHDLRADIVCGSFVPTEAAEAAAAAHLTDADSPLVWHAEPGYAALDLDLDDLDVVFAYPWPTDEPFYCHLFEQLADWSAVLLLASRAEGMRAFRKVAD